MVWVVVAVSCTDCNTIGVQAFDHAPTDAEQEECRKSAHGMWCLRVLVFECEINGPAVVGEVDRG